MGVVAHGAPVFRIGGDPGGISTRAAVMMDRANEFADIHAGLSSLTSDGWEGRAADHFRYKFNLQIKGWLDAQIAFSDASTAYQSYASTLLSAQNQCDEIRSRWEQGQQAVEQAQNNQADARSQAAAEGGTPMFDASCDEGPGRSTMAAAEADFQTLVNQVNESGTLLINALNSGISKLPERTWMDAVARTFKSVYDGFVEAVTDLVKLTWTIGGYAVIYDFGRFLCQQMTVDEFLAKWVELPGETIAGLTKALSENPGAFFEGFIKGLFDYDTFIDDPGRWVGHALPDILITIATAGAGSGASAGEKGATAASRASRIGKAVFKELTHIADVEDIAHLSKLAFNKLKKVGIHAVSNLSDLAKDAAERLRRFKEAGHTGQPPLLSPADNTPSVPHSGAHSSPSHGAPSYGTGGTPSASTSPSYGSGSTPNTSGTPAPSHGNGGYSGNASHGGAGAVDPNSRFAPPTHQQNGTPGAAQPATTPQASSGGNASHASHGGADVKDSALSPTDPGHRSNGVSSAAQPAATPHASAAGDAGTGGHAAPANAAPSASNGAHNNAFMNADTGGATHGAGSTANGATGAPATGAGTHSAPGAGTHGAGTTGAPATGAPATGTHGAGTTSAPAAGAPAAGAPSTGAGAHGAPATGAPATGSHGAGASGAPAAPGAPSSGSHGAASGHSAAGGSPAAPARNNGMGEHVATGEPIPPRKPTDPDKPATGSGRDFQSTTNKTDTHSGGNQKNLDHLDFKPGDSDKVSNGQYRPIDPSSGPHRRGTDGAPKGDAFEPQPAAAGDGVPPQRPNWLSDKMREHFSEKIDNLHSGEPGANDLLRSRRDEPTFAGNSNPVHGNGETRGADELVGAGVGRSEASVGAQGSYERAGAFGGSDPSRVSHGADGFGGTADFGANAGHAGHGAHGVSNSADVGGGVGDASRGTHAAGAPTGQGGGHVGADTGTHGGSSAPAQGPHRADPGMSTGDTHGISRADSTPGHGDTPRAGHGGDGTPDAPTTPKKETPAGDGLGGDKQPHSGKHAADTPATHADEAADASKAGHGSGDASGSGKADADAQHGHDSVEHADAEPKAKDHSANGKADDAADSTRHGDKTEADKPTSDKSHKEDDAAHHDGDEHPKDTDDKHTTKTDDADAKSTKDEADTHKSDKDADGKSDKDAAEHADADPKAKDHSANGKADDADTHKSDKDGDGKSDKDEADTHKSDKDSGERADADPKAKDHSANGKADDAADSAHHGDKDEADTHKSDKDGDGKSDKDDAAHHDGDEHPKDTDDKHTTKTDDADTHKSDKDADTKSTKEEGDTHKSDKVGDEEFSESERHGDSKEVRDEMSEHSNDTDAHHAGDSDKPRNSDNKPSDESSLSEDSALESPAPSYGESPDPTSGHLRPVDETVDALLGENANVVPATPEELAERSPKMPKGLLHYDDKEPPAHYKDGLGSYKNGAAITLDHHIQLGKGTHPNITTTSEMMRSEYIQPGTTKPNWRTDIHHGAIPGTERKYESIADLTADFNIDGIDRTGDYTGNFTSPMVNGDICAAEYRSTPLTNYGLPYHQYEFTGKELPPGSYAEFSIAAPDHNSPGGAPQLVFMERQPNGSFKEMTIEQLLEDGYIEGRQHHKGTVKIPDAEDLARRLERTKHRKL